MQGPIPTVYNTSLAARKLACSNKCSILEMCKRLNYHQLETLVSRSASPNSQEPISSQLRLQLAPEALQVLQQTIQIISQQTGRALSPAQALEMLCADYLARHAPLDPPLDQANDDSAVECSARNIWTAATACQEEPCPNNNHINLVQPAPAHWETPRLRYNPESRLATSAQRAQLIRRDGYRCKTPGCPHHLFLQVHHIKFYAHQGQTVPDNLLCLCSKCHRNVHQGHLHIQGHAPHNLTFHDSHGRDLQRQSQLQLAEWLDFFVGWQGQETDSHQIRAMTSDKCMTI